MLFRLVTLAALFGFLFGFDEGVIAVAGPSIIAAFGITPLQDGIMTAAVPLGAIGGAILAALWSDRLGRRRVLLISSVLFALGSVAGALAVGVTMLTMGRLLLGVAIGASAMAAPLFLAELAPDRSRGAIVGAFQLMITIGILVSYLTGLLLSGPDNWRLMIGLGLVPALVTFLGMLTAPESPRWLAAQGRAEEARRTVARLLGGASGEADRMVAGLAQGGGAMAGRSDWGAFLAPGVLPVVTFAMMAFLLQQVSGINAVIYYAPRILESSGYSSVSDQLLGTVGIGLVNVLATVVAMLLVDRLGRRPLLIWGFAGSAVFLLLLAVAQLPSVPAWWGLVGLFGYIAVFAVSLGPLPWIYMSELFPIHLRSRGMALASVANWSVNFLVVFLFPVATANLGSIATFGLFAAACVAGMIYAAARAPETMRQSLETLGRRVDAVPAGAAD